jgi:hypothetical protein
MTAILEPGLTFAVVSAAPNPGSQHTTDQRELLARQVGIDLHHHRLAGDHLVGEGAQATHAVCNPAIAAQPAGDGHAVGGAVAQVGLVVQAEPAFDAGRRETADYPFTNGHPTDL